VSTVYIVARDKYRPISGDYIETRVYILGNRVFGNTFPGREPRVDPERSQILNWTSIHSITQVQDALCTAGYNAIVCE